MIGLLEARSVMRYWSWWTAPGDKWQQCRVQNNTMLSPSSIWRITGNIVDDIYISFPLFMTFLKSYITYTGLVHVS